jgi:threonine/homoserine/homoserine lactone efflux protein
MPVIAWRMTYSANLWLFFVLLFGIIIVPGMDMFFVIANSLTGGKMRGLAATFGIMVGGICHTIFGAFFVGVITKLAPQLITFILFASAIYMGWIGMTLLRSSSLLMILANPTRKTCGPHFGRG